MKQINNTCKLISGLLISVPLYAGSMGAIDSVHPWFGSIGTGYSWTKMPGINNPNLSQWDAATQGYDSFLGNRSFLTFAIGKKIHEYVDVSIMYMMHENFNYQKFQSGNSATPDFTGSQRTRYFTLNNKSVLVNGFLHPDNYWWSYANVELKPYIGAGIGYAYNLVNSFYTIGNQIQGVGDPNVGSTDSIGSPKGRNSFSWQGTAALNLHPQNSSFSINTGYRYFDGGNFNGSSSIYTNANGFVTATPWSGSVKANQFFVEFQYTA